MSVQMFKVVNGGIQGQFIEPEHAASHKQAGWVFDRKELEKPKVVEKPEIVVDKKKKDVPEKPEIVVDKKKKDVPEKPKPKKIKKSTKKVIKKVEKDDNQS